MMRYVVSGLLGRRSARRVGGSRTVVLLTIWALLPGVAIAQGKCDRACLEGIAEQYLDALVAKDPKKLQVASNLKYTENGQRLLLGDSLWNSITGRGTYKLHIADQTAGQIVTFSTMREAGNPMIIAVMNSCPGPVRSMPAKEETSRRGRSRSRRWLCGRNISRSPRSRRWSRIVKMVRRTSKRSASRARRSCVRHRRPIGHRVRIWCASPTCISAACS